MSAKLLRRFWLMTFVILALIACGGGGSGSGTTAGGGIGGTGISFGTVQQFGSIFVNGVEFDSDSAAVTLNGSPGPDVGTDPHRGLKKGMVVKVAGSFNGNTGAASSIEFRNNLEGPVCDRQVAGGITTLRVLGQTVIIDDVTIVDNNADIQVGDIVEVSGLPDAQERIRASFIEKKQSLQTAEVKGRVDTANGSISLAINALNVDISNAIIDNSIPGGQPAVGQFVEVKGTIFGCSGTTDTLTADTVELEPEGAGAIANGVRAEVEGFVTAFTLSSDFTVGSQPVMTTTGTLFVGGLQTEIALGLKLEVEGSLAGGVLTATKVEFKESVKIESNAIATTSDILLEGLPGISVTANIFTEFKGGTLATAANLAPLDGRNVRIRGRASGATSVLASEIEDRGPASGNVNGDVILQGLVAKTDVTSPTFKILGVTVDTAGLDPDEFKNVNDNPIIGGSTAFFNALMPNGGLVKAKGSLPSGPSGNVLGADTLKEVELEN